MHDSDGKGDSSTSSRTRHHTSSHRNKRARAERVDPVFVPEFGK